MSVTFVPQTQVVAACQFAPKLFDVEGNLATAQELAFEALAKGARVVVLPESCIGGYNLHSEAEAARVAQMKDGYQTQAFVPLARRFNAYIVFGYTELCEGKFYNSAAVVGPGGLALNEQKKNLYGSDNLWAQPSEQMPGIVLTSAGRLGVLICRDIKNNFRESYIWHNSKHRFYRKGDADVIACPTNWGGSYGYPDAAWIELVEETRSNVIIANRVGKERDMSYKGGSVIIDRDRRTWTHGSSFSEACVVGGIVVI